MSALSYLLTNRPFWLVVVILIVAVFVIIAAYATGLFPPSPHVFAELKSPDGEFLVEGRSDFPMGWGVSLYWKRPDQPCATYYLDHDGPYWRQVEMVRTADHLLVKAQGQGHGTISTSRTTPSTATETGTRTPGRPVSLWEIQGAGADPMRSCLTTLAGSQCGRIMVEVEVHKLVKRSGRGEPFGRASWLLASCFASESAVLNLGVDDFCQAENS